MNLRTKRSRSSNEDHLSTLGWLVRSLTVIAFIGAQQVAASVHGDCDDCIQGTAEIKTCDESQDAVGWAQLTELNSDEGVKVVAIDLEIDGLEAATGAHAVHIHESGVCDPCSAAKGHFDPGPHGFSNPDGNHPFHSGDLENIYLDENGDGKLSVVTTRVTLSPGPLSIFDQDGSAFIVHVEADTYCPEGEAKGCAGGARAACGIINPVADAEETTD